MNFMESVMAIKELKNKWYINVNTVNMKEKHIIIETNIIVWNVID